MSEADEEQEMVANMHRENMLQTALHAWTLFSRHLRTFTLDGLNQLLTSNLLLLAHMRVLDNAHDIRRIRM